MSTLLYVIGGVLAVILLIVIFMYNSLIKTQNMVKQSWSGIDVQLKRRADLIPNLIKTVKGYAKHEKETLESVTEARTSLMKASQQGDAKGAAEADNQLTGALKSLFAVSENYPDLKANQNFMQLQEELSETEDQIAAARRIYNENVTYMNNKVQSVPTNIIAKMFDFNEEEFFEANNEDKKNVEVKF